MDQLVKDVTELHEVALVAMVAVTLGLVLLRFRQPPMVGYIIAGVVLGPTGFGLVSQSGPVRLLAELGVLILLFLIGMELSLRAFVAVARPAVLIAFGQLAAAFGITALFALILDWSLAQTMLLAFVVAVSSTAVAIKMLDEIGELRSETGRITIGVLIAQDIAIVPMLILTESLGGGDVSILNLVVKIALAIGFLIWLVWYLGRPGKMQFDNFERLRDKPDILALVALAICFSAAALSGFLGLSPAYGAFVSGLLLANTTMRAELISVTLPIQSVLVFVFFLSIGLLLDVPFIVNNFQLVALFVCGVIILKTALNITLTRMAGYSFGIAIPAGLAMAQVGEFSFVLAAAGFSNGTIDFNAYRLAITVIAISLLVSPFWMISARHFHDTALQKVTTFRAALAKTYPAGVAGFERGLLWSLKKASISGAYSKSLLAKMRGKSAENDSAELKYGGELPPPETDAQPPEER